MTASVFWNISKIRILFRWTHTTLTACQQWAEPSAEPCLWRGGIISWVLMGSGFLSPKHSFPYSQDELDKLNAWLKRIWFFFLNPEFFLPNEYCSFQSIHLRELDNTSAHHVILEFFLWISFSWILKNDFYPYFKNKTKVSEIKCSEYVRWGSE